MTSGIGILSQKAPDNFKTAKKFLELLGVVRHLQGKGIPGNFKLFVHFPGQYQRRNRYQKDCNKHDRAEIEIHPQCTEHDTAPEYDIEDGHIVVIV